MRELTKEETEKIEKKLRQYVGSNYSSMMNPLHKLVLNNQKVFYTSTELLKRAGVVGRENIMCIGTCLGRFTKTNQFRIKITALPLIALYRVNTVKVKTSCEMGVLYGNHVQRCHLFGMPTDIHKNSGVLLTTQYDIPLGFGVMTKGGTEIVSGDRSAVIVIRQGDTGEYLRGEELLM
ncbi:60S ribosome subunit biogenesis protein NIP7 [Nematocida sp. LUAm3]|nr:60S ribosome subunit biogenesis protein NIP7 [Nematocida sp. LUAm3]KAI5174891.1 60S ribosome subunit biogenesis protein NIP7 [Nematocida sp. LUAm2]KAI5177511.1 60S ribosome subunit biogenesis protein NIP7 [Nematocida sp. LUAm1]